MTPKRAASDSNGLPTVDKRSATTRSSGKDLFSSSRKPRFLQLAAEFRRKIETGAWPPDSQIPPLDDLMKTYQVSRMTVRQALGELENQGLIRRGRGVGTFVEPENGLATRLNIPTSWKEAVSFGAILDTHTIQSERMAANRIPSHGIQTDGTLADSYHYLKRLHSLQAEPYCFSELYVETAIYKAHATSFKNSPSAAVLASIAGLQIQSARQNISIIEADFHSAHALKIEVGAPVAEVRRIIISGGRIIQFARFEFPTKFIHIEFDLLK